MKQNMGACMLIVWGACWGVWVPNPGLPCQVLHIHYHIIQVDVHIMVMSHSKFTTCFHSCTTAAINCTLWYLKTKCNSWKHGHISVHQPDISVVFSPLMFFCLLIDNDVVQSHCRWNIKDKMMTSHCAQTKTIVETWADLRVVPNHRRRWDKKKKKNLKMSTSIFFLHVSAAITLRSASLRCSSSLSRSDLTTTSIPMSNRWSPHWVVVQKKESESPHKFQRCSPIKLHCLLL